LKFEFVSWVLPKFLLLVEEGWLALVAATRAP